MTGKVLALDRTLEAVLPALLALLDVSGEDPQWRALDPPQRQQRTLDAVKRLLLREVQVQPLLLLFEDLHWIDSETQAVLDRLVEGLPHTRLLLLVNYRPEYEHRWGSKASYTQLRLDPLPPESALELLHHVLGEHDSIEALKPILIARTEGNPFFLEESVRTLAETHVLVGGPGAYRLARTLAEVQVPPTVQAILAARVDRLSPEDKDLLQSAAVVGKDVPFPVLAAIVTGSEEDLRRGLAHLQAAEFLYEVSLFPDLEYTFKHALTHEVAYGGLLHERRRSIHARIVEVIEALHADRLAEHVERLASHALRGEQWTKAVRYAGDAGHKAGDRRAHREAVTWFEQALAALARLPETPEHLAQSVDLRIDTRSALVSMGDFASIPYHLQQAEPLAEALGDPGRQSAVAMSLAHCLWATGEFQPALAAGERALEFADRAGDRVSRRGARFVLGEIRHVLGDFDRAVTHFMDNLEVETRDEKERRGRSPAISGVVNRRWLAMSLAELGRFPDALALASEAVTLAEAADHPYSLMNALVGLGYAFTRKGDADRAISVLERACEVSTGLDFTMWSVCAMPLSAAYGLAGRPLEAIRVLQDPRIQSSSRPNTGSEGESWLLAGRLDEAEQRAQRELADARTQRSWAEEAWGLYVLGEVAAAREPCDTVAAEGHLRRALGLAEDRGMRPLAARIHLALGKLYRRAGAPPRAEAHMASATMLFQEMHMSSWLEQATAAMQE